MSPSALARSLAGKVEGGELTALMNSLCHRVSKTTRRHAHAWGAPAYSTKKYLRSWTGRAVAAAAPLLLVSAPTRLSCFWWRATNLLLCALTEYSSVRGCGVAAKPGRLSFRQLAPSSSAYILHTYKYMYMYVLNILISPPVLSVHGQY